VRAMLPGLVKAAGAGRDSRSNVACVCCSLSGIMLRSVHDDVLVLTQSAECSSLGMVAEVCLTASTGSGLPMQTIEQHMHIKR
jgi:hypothetical protein